MITNYPRKSKAPHIGDNGNWFIGAVDTGVRANGQSNTEIIPISIAASDWNAETKEVTIDCIGISANEADQIVTLIPSVESKAACNEAAIECVAIDTNSFTLKADTIPAEDIHIYVAMEVVGKVTGGTDNSVYSLEETVVGTWIDGKPIYQCTFCGALPNITSGLAEIADITQCNIETIIDSKVVVQQNRNPKSLSEIQIEAMYSQPLMAVQSNGSQYINTGIVPKLNTRVVIDFQETTWNGSAVIGHHESESTSFRLGSASSTSGLFWDFVGSSNRVKMNNGSTRARYHLELGNNYIKNADTDEIIASGSQITSMQSSQPIYICGDRNYASAKYYRIQIFEDDTLIADYMPYLSGAIACFKELVSGSLVFSHSTTNFVAIEDTTVQPDGVVLCAKLTDATCGGSVVCATLEYTKTTDAATISLPDAAAMAASYEQGVNES